MMHTTSLTSTAPATYATTTDPVMGRVVVAARLQLIGQAVCAALSEHGIRAETLSWRRAKRALPRELGTEGVAVLLDDLTSLQDVEETSSIVSIASARCVVLTQRPPGPAWGALLTAGAAAVVTAEGSLGDISAVVARVAERESVMDEGHRAELVRAWEAWQVEDEQLRSRVALLSPREEQILSLLSQGSSVVDIIDALGVSEATVRTQMKSMRRKLGVDSGLGAVAMLASVGRLT
jgi:DNA-binding NarL/FixJ family response regulator